MSKPWRDVPRHAARRLAVSAVVSVWARCGHGQRHDRLTGSACTEPPVNLDSSRAQSRWPAPMINQRGAGSRVSVWVRARTLPHYTWPVGLVSRQPRAASPTRTRWRLDCARLEDSRPTAAQGAPPHRLRVGRVPRARCLRVMAASRIPIPRHRRPFYQRPSSKRVAIVNTNCQLRIIQGIPY